MRADITDDLAASLIAAVSVIETSQQSGKRPSHAFGSDTMFDMALNDYKNSIGRYRADRVARAAQRFPDHDPSRGIVRSDFVKYVAVQWPDIPHPTEPGRHLILYGPQTFRHHHILLFGEQMALPRAKPENQGFSLEWDGPFMSRREAAEHALAVGQITKLGAGPDLYSEDLW